MSGPSQQTGEFELIERLLAHFPAPSVSLGPGDDAAVVRADHPLVITTDTLVEGRHFRRETFAARDVGWKSLAVNLSDVAAMGARPSWFLCSLALPLDWELRWVDDFAAGLACCAEEFGVELIGGNVAGGAREHSITITALGQLDAGPAWTRRGARAGDVIGVIGELGWAATGLRVLEVSAANAPGEANGVGELGPWLAFEPASNPREPLVRAQRRPIPRCGAARALRAGAVEVHAAIDVSDGLLQDLRHVLRASGVGARLELSALKPSGPLERYARESDFDPWPAILAGGEDYALLLVTPTALAIEGYRPVGVCVADPTELTLTLEGQPFPTPESFGFRQT